MTEKIVLPGDTVGTSEEFVAGSGTYSEKGVIYASAVGIVETNKRDRTITVVPKTSTPPVPKVGDIVIGRITDIKGSVALVEIACIKGKEDRIASFEQAAIHISNVKMREDGYVEYLDREFGYFDIVKARVIDVKTMRLSTVDKDLGVLKALCSVCKVGLQRKGKVLECPKCKRTETRKLSEDYGKGII
mgnify:CR=1 FL=1